MRDYTIEYFSYADTFVFNDVDYDLARRLNMNIKEFKGLMINKFNAVVDFASEICFHEEKDIQLAINYLQPSIDGYWVMFALTRNKRG